MPVQHHCSKIRRRWRLATVVGSSLLIFCVVLFYDSADGILLCVALLSLSHALEHHVKMHFLLERCVFVLFVSDAPSSFGHPSPKKQESTALLFQKKTTQSLIRLISTQGDPGMLCVHVFSFGGGLDGEACVTPISDHHVVCTIKTNTSRTRSFSRFNSSTISSCKFNSLESETES